MGSGVGAPPVSPGQQRTVSNLVSTCSIPSRSNRPEAKRDYCLKPRRARQGNKGWALVMRAIKPIERLVLVSFTHCCASTPSLSTWWSSTALKGELVSRWVSRLDAFSGYPVRTWLPCYAAGATTGPLEVRPSRSSRTKDRSSQFSYTYGR